MPPVHLNYISITVSPETYKTLASTEFLRTEFASFEERTTKIADGASYKGIYLYGRNTYVEFLPASGATRAGSVGFGMGVDDHEQLALVKDALSRKYHLPLQIARRTRTLELATVPWFDYIRCDWLPRGPLALWIMAYPAAWLEHLYPGLETSKISTSRWQVLAPRVERDKLLKDVRRLVLWSEPSEINTMTSSLISLGYQPSFDGLVETLRGPDIEFVFVPLKPLETRKVEIYFSLTRKYDGPLAYRFPDNSDLTFVSSLARWSFPGRTKTANGIVRTQTAHTSRKPAAKK